jgi:hypothetical protein
MSWAASGSAHRFRSIDRWSATRRRSRPGGGPWCPGRGPDRRLGWGPLEELPVLRVPRRRPTSALMHNLSEAVHKVVTRHRRCLQPQPTPPPQESTTSSARQAASRRRADNTGAGTAAVHALMTEGLTIRAIMSRLGLSRGAVRRYARAQTPAELLGPTHWHHGQARPVQAQSTGPPRARHHRQPRVIRAVTRAGTVAHCRRCNDSRCVSATTTHHPKWTYFYLYVIIHIYSRYMVGWLIAERESARHSFVARGSHAEIKKPGRALPRVPRH